MRSTEERSGRCTSRKGEKGKRHFPYQLEIRERRGGWIDREGGGSREGSLLKEK